MPLRCNGVEVYLQCVLYVFLLNICAAKRKQTKQSKQFLLTYYTNLKTDISV